MVLSLLTIGCDKVRAMKKITNKIPPILGILLSVFFGLFALDSLQNPIGFLIHLIPSFVFLFISFIGYKRPIVGGILFLATAIFLQYFTHGRALILVGLVAIVGIIFILNARLRK